MDLWEIRNLCQVKSMQSETWVLWVPQNPFMGCRYFQLLEKHWFRTKVPNFYWTLQYWQVWGQFLKLKGSVEPIKPMKQRSSKTCVVRILVNWNRVKQGSPVEGLCCQDLWDILSNFDFSREKVNGRAMLSVYWGFCQFWLWIIRISRRVKLTWKESGRARSLSAGQ